MSRLPLLLLAIACTGLEPVNDPPGPQGDTDTDTGADTDGQPDLDTEGHPIPDYWQAIDRDPACADYGDTAIPGATSWFIGDYVLDGETATGIEYWALLANKAWKDAGGKDCLVVWRTDATVQDPVACVTCDFGLSVYAAVDPETTSCPDEMYAGSETMEFVYDVAIRSDGTADFYFESTNPVGSWYASPDEQRVAFVSESSCVWF